MCPYTPILLETACISSKYMYIFIYAYAHGLSSYVVIDIQIHWYKSIHIYWYLHTVNKYFFYIHKVMELIHRYKCKECYLLAWI